MFMKMQHCNTSALGIKDAFFLLGEIENSNPFCRVKTEKNILKNFIFEFFEVRSGALSYAVIFQLRELIIHFHHMASGETLFLGNNRKIIIILGA